LASALHQGATERFCSCPTRLPRPAQQLQAETLIAKLNAWLQLHALLEEVSHSGRLGKGAC
jgi:hypothetical protein